MLSSRYHALTLLDAVPREVEHGGAEDVGDGGEGSSDGGGPVVAQLVVGAVEAGEAVA